MVDDTGAARGPKGPMGPGMGGCGGFCGGFGRGIWGEVMARAGVWVEALEFVQARLRTRSRSSHQAELPGQGHENQVPGGNLSVFSAHQAI